LFDYEMPSGGKRDVCWELPSEGNGLYSTYNRNDELADGLDQIGTYQTIQAILTLAKAWKNRNTGAILEIGDISRAGGLDTSAHETHEDGKAFDMRPLRNDGGSGTPIGLDATSYHPLYHRDWTKAFIKLVQNLYPGSVVYFNDKFIYEDPEFRNFVKFADKHFDHLHIIFPGGERATNKKGQII
jgi:hypothetical protein